MNFRRVRKHRTAGLIAVACGTESGRRSTPASIGRLLRRVADELEEFGVVQVQDITFTSTPTADCDDLTMTVYDGRG